MKSSAFTKMSKKAKQRRLRALIKHNTKKNLTDKEIDEIVEDLNPNIQYKIQVVATDEPVTQITYEYHYARDIGEGHTYKNIISKCIFMSHMHKWEFEKYESLKEEFFNMKILKIKQIHRPLIILQNIEESTMYDDVNEFSVDNILMIYLPRADREVKVS